MFRIIFTAGVFATAIGAGVMLVKERERTAPMGASAAVVWDASSSMNRRDQPQSLAHVQRCGTLATVVEQMIVGLPIRKSSRLFVVTTGTAGTANLPELKVESKIPAESFSPFQEGQTKEDFLNDLVTVCKSWAVTESSPILAGVEIAVEQLRARGCAKSGNCRLALVSDLRESASIPVRRRLAGADAADGPVLVPTSGIDLYVCGFAITDGGEHVSVPRLLAVWSGVFTAPPRFEPFCPGTGDPNKTQ